MLARRSKWVLLGLLLLLSGCWDRREIEERSTSLMTGVDLCAEGEDCFLVSTRQVAIPGRIPMGPGGATAEDTVFVLDSPGKDGPDSSREAQQELNRKLSFAHTRLLVWSEDFARRGTQSYLDYLDRVPEIRPLMWVAVVEGKAEQVVRAKPELDRVPALYFNDMFEEAVGAGRMPSQSYLGKFSTALSNQGEDPIAPLLRPTDRDYPEFSGLAIFRDAKMVGKLNMEETATFLALLGRRRSTDLMRIPLPNGRHAYLGIFGRKARYRFGWADGRVLVHIAVEMETDLRALSADLRSDDPTVLSLIERKAETEFRRRMVALMAKLQQEYQADSLGVGARVRAYLPAAWAQIQDWREAYQRARFTFDVDINIRRTGPAKD